ncbi:MAG: exonuclease subunit SbcD [Flavobacteriaceae bacterium]|jgi:exonuclease SbcD|nr:exonuclease subunit SbcD [Flavobacteriaceae bacterium]
MKILHTADWHLGKRLDSFSRMEEQKKVMSEICEIADRENVDLVIVAGDLFDVFNPSTEAIELLYKTLKRLAKNGERPVIAIAGNHDSPDRIDAPDPLARECGIIMIGYPNAQINLFSLPGFEVKKSSPGFLEINLNKYNYPVRILHTPYANEIRLKEYLGAENKEIRLNEILKENWKKIANEFCDEQGVNLLTAHLFIMKKGGKIPEEPEGEKPIKIGNADLIYSEIIPHQIQYTALGHLHACRNMGSEEKPVVYASSPLAYSFSEAGQQKYVVLIEAEPGRKVTMEKISLKEGKELLRKTFTEVDEAVNWLEKNQNSLVELTLETVEFMTAEERRKIYQAHPGIVHLIPKLSKEMETDAEVKEIDLSLDVRLLFKDYFKSKHNQEPNQEILELFNEILSENDTH